MPQPIAIRLFTGLFLATVLVGTAAPAAAVRLVKGQTIYIPSYSNIISGNQRIVLRANLIIHNTDPSRSIEVLRIDHYDTNGQLVEHYLQHPLKLAPLAATRVIIRAPKPGDEGAGANFIVQWRSAEKVTEPLLDCIMLGTAGTHSYSFSSHGRIIQEEMD